MRALSRPLIIIIALLLIGVGTWTAGPAAAAGGPASKSEMFRVDLCLKAVRPDGDRPCVSFIDGSGRGWYIAHVAGVHRSLRALSFKPGRRVRVIGDACRDCMDPICGAFAGYIFNARIVPYRQGDVNGDGEVNTGDIVAVIDSMGDCPDAPQLCPADVNYDGYVGIEDLAKIMELVGIKVHISVPQR